MAQLLANELLIMTFKELLNETNFKYMSSICTVCKKWDELVKLVIIEEIKFRSENKLLIKYGHDNFLIAKNISYNSSNSAFNISINAELYHPYCANGRVKLEKRKLFINFRYKDGNKNNYVQFNFGTLLFHKVEKPYEKFEIKYKINWNFKDCNYIFSLRDSEIIQNVGLYYSNHYYHFSIIFKVGSLIISLKKMCAILDLLDKKMNTKDYFQYSQYIMRIIDPSYPINNIYNNNQRPAFVTAGNNNR